MIKTKKKFISMLLCLAMVVTSIAALPLTGFATEGWTAISGTDIEWRVLDADGNGKYELEISGTGTVPGLCTAWISGDVTKDKIEKVSFEGVTDCGNQVFKEYTALKEIVLGSGVKTINYQNFFKCSALTTITGGEDIEKISYAFQDCSSLTSYPYFPKLKEVIGSSYNGCNNISGVARFPGTLTAVGSAVQNVKVSELIFEEGATAVLAKYQLRHSPFTKVTFASGMSLADTAEPLYGPTGDWNAPSATVTFIVPKGTTIDTAMTANVNATVYPSAKYSSNAPRLVRVLPNATEIGNAGSYYWSVGGTGNDTLLISGTLAADENFSTADKKPWKSYNSGLKKIIIDSGIENIPAKMFEKAEGEDAYSNVDTIQLPEGLKTIGANAFKGIASDVGDTLNVTLPSTLTKIGSDAFDGCAMANTFVLPAAVESDEVDATNITVNNTAFDDDNVMKVSGNFGAGNSIVVAKIKNNITDAEACRYLISSAETGDMSFNVKLASNASGGLYTLTLEDKNGVFFTNDNIVFVNRVAFNSLMGAFNPGSAADVNVFITTNKLDLGLVYAPADNAASLTVSTYIYDMIRNESLLTNVTPATLNKAYRHAVIMTLAGENKLADISSFAADISKLSQEGEPLKAWYDYSDDVSNEKIDAWRTKVAERLNGVNFANYNDFEEKLKTSYVFAILADPATNALTKKAVEMAETEINDAEYTLSNYLTDNVAIKLTNAKKNYTGFDYAQLKADIKAYYEENLYTGNGNNNNNNTTVTVPNIGGGGGGGGAVKPHPIKDNNQSTSSENNSQTQPGEEKTNITGFADMADFEWAQPAVKALRDKNIISGDENGNFNPDNSITREEFVKMVANLLELPEAEQSKDFADVKADDWFKSFLDRAYENGIISGVSETEFGSGRNISRQDMCVILFNAIKYKGLDYNQAELAFSDMNDISDYAETAVKVLCSLKVINGYDDNTFKPAGNASRAEAAKVIYMIIGLK